MVTVSKPQGAPSAVPAPGLSRMPIALFCCAQALSRRPQDKRCVNQRDASSAEGRTGPENKAVLLNVNEETGFFLFNSEKTNNHALGKPARLAAAGALSVAAGGG